MACDAVHLSAVWHVWEAEQRTPGTSDTLRETLDDASSTPNSPSNVETQRESPRLFPPECIGCDRHALPLICRLAEGRDRDQVGYKLDICTSADNRHGPTEKVILTSSKCIVCCVVSRCMQTTQAKTFAQQVPQGEGIRE